MMSVFVFILLVISVAWPSHHASAGKSSDLLAEIHTETPGSVQADAVRDLIQRKVPARSSAFHVAVNASLGPANLDTFQIESDGLTVNITGTTGVAAAWGFYHYLNKYCACHISWAGDQLNIPSKLPKVQPALKITSPNRFRYYQNVCTVSYSFAFWNWTRWEREIDWMAMNGINLPLAFNAQEAIWQKVYLKMGFTQADLDAHFGGPAFLAWSRMGNMHGFGGPLTPTWHANQLQLQHQILKRMRDLGITPVLPAFAGHVPKTFKRLFPNASVSVGSAWGNFAKDPQFCCDLLLEPTDPLFRSIGKAFIEAMAEEFNGTDHIYNGDMFNEMAPKQGDTKYLAQASKAVYNAIVEADPKGVWLMQDWLFQSGFWTQDRIKAYLQGVPKGRMIVLDLGSDTVPQYSRTQSFYGQPFIWCLLGNFGGNHGLYGKLDTVNEGLFAARKFSGSTMVGTGITPEGINQNDVMYAFLYDLSWRSKPVASVSQWIANYSTARYGRTSLLALRAWDILRATVYNCKDSHSNHNQGPIVKTPQTSGIQPYIWYDWTMVVKAWNLMLQSVPQLKNNHLFKYDLVDITRQVLQDLSYHIYLDFGVAYKNRNINSTITTLDKFLDLILDLDTILSTDSRWLLGIWLEAAKAVGSTVQEKKWLEYNARNQLTLWGPSGEIRDYANKHWAGLVKTFYYRRWEMFAFQVEEALFTKKTFDPAHFQELCFNLIEKPWTTETNKFTTKPIGDTSEVSQLLFEKYQEDLSFYATRHNPINMNTTSGQGLSYIRP